MNTAMNKLRARRREARSDAAVRRHANLGNFSVATPKSQDSEVATPILPGENLIEWERPEKNIWDILTRPGLRPPSHRRIAKAEGKL